MNILCCRVLACCLLVTILADVAQAQSSSPAGEQANAETFTTSFAATVRAALLNDKCKVLSPKEAERIGFFSVTILETIRGDIGTSAANRIIDEGTAWAAGQVSGSTATAVIQSGFRAGQEAMENRLGATTADGIDFYELVAADLLIKKCRLFQTDPFNGKHVAIHLAELETAAARTEAKLEANEAAAIRARTTAKFASAPDACGPRASIVAMIGLFKSEFIRTSGQR